MLGPGANVQSPSTSDATAHSVTSAQANVTAAMLGPAANEQSPSISDATAHSVTSALVDVTTHNFTGSNWPNFQSGLNTFASTNPQPYHSINFSQGISLLPGTYNPPYFTSCPMASTQVNQDFRYTPFAPGATNVTTNATAPTSSYINSSRWCPNISSVAANQTQPPFTPPTEIPNAYTSSMLHNIWRPHAAAQQTDSFVDITLSPTQIASRQVIQRDLPNFSGHPEDWPLFITNFEQSTERCGFSNQENLIRLQKCLKGSALEAVRGKLMIPSTVPLAIETLRMLFGRPDVIHESLQRKLRQTAPVSIDRLETLINLSLAVQNYRATMQAIGLSDYLNDPMLLNDLLNKLPGDMKLDRGRRRLEIARVDIGAFDDWMFNIATCASQVTPTSFNLLMSTEEKPIRKNQKERILLHSDGNALPESVKPPCKICNEEHSLQNCPSFISKSRQERWNFVKENKLCIRCFKNHTIRRCYSKRMCGVDGCTMPHNPLLHSQTTNSSYIATDKNKEETTGCNAASTASNNVLFHSRQRSVLFRCIPVTLYANGKSYKTLALIDEGSSLSLIDSDIAEEMQLNGPSQELCMKWTGNISQVEQNSKFVNIKIASQQDGSKMYSLQNVRTVSQLDLPAQSLSKSDVHGKSHLSSLPLQFYENLKPKILIGLDNAKLITPIESRVCNDEGLVATRCRFGWSVYGREYADCHSPNTILHICDCNKNNNLDEAMRHYFSIESIGVDASVKPLVSRDDERALAIMKNTTKYLPHEKRWETGLLWKYDNISLPNSFQMAKQRLECLERKMLKDLNIKEFINEKISEYLKKGYIRKLGNDEKKQNSKSWYLPIFVVSNPNKKKLRLVWDAAAKTGNFSLNSVLMKGPDLFKNLNGILIRFRERPVAICGDIREMFHQIKVIDSDKIAQKFLWRNCDTLAKPEVYQMEVMTFGASCSPSLASYVKDRNADRFIVDYPHAVIAIKQNTFVDDWLQSVDSEEEMIELSTAVKKIHSEGGFEMRNWISNSKAVLNSLNGHSNATTKCISDPERNLEKILGVWWLPESDEFTFLHKFSDDIFEETFTPTKRELLRMLMTIFDPLGLLGFFVVEAKINLQDVWRSGVSWDEQIHDNEKRAWLAWVHKLKYISQIRISRCYFVGSPGKYTELHVFVDASVQAYAAVAYLRSVDGDLIGTSIVASKTRVAPLKPISVPRMELMAAILGLRLAKFIRGEASINISRRIFWSDSKDVIYWIRSDARKFQQFVAVRVGEILQESNINEWRWIPTNENVADDGTKVNSNRKIHENYRWFNGPKFLSLSENYWPKNDFDQHIHFTEDVPTDSSAQKKFNEFIPSPDPKRFSKWEKLIKAQMYVLRFLQRVMPGPYRNNEVQALMEMRPIKAAEMIVFRNCQQDEYNEELQQLKYNNMVSRKSRLLKYSPYIDDCGILRVKGRIDAAVNVPFDVKRPIILPRNHYVSYLISEYHHRMFHHHHNEIIVNEIRQKYCIPGLRALVRQTAKNCQKCKNNRACPSPPEMGNLPPERIAAFIRPFTFTGIDYFGPFEIIVGRRREKRWGVLFTCMTVRAVHIEIASSLSTDSFLMVLKQFISRRGVPARIFSDNATNFRGASRVLKDEIEKVSFDRVEREYADIEWSFIPPVSPHMGGTWERMIRSVKSVLHDILPQHNLREEVLRAAIADIENILNMRPLTYVPLETADSEALTPNHFLLGSSSGIRERGNIDSSGAALSQNFRIAGQIAESFWKRWVRECLPSLTKRTKWFQTTEKQISPGDVVIVVDENTKRNTWTKAMVIDVVQAKDGKVRSAVIKTSYGLSTRPVVKLARLDLVNSLTSTKFTEGAMLNGK